MLLSKKIIFFALLTCFLIINQKTNAVDINSNQNVIAIDQGQVYVVDLKLSKTDYKAGETITGDFVLDNEDSASISNIYYRIYLTGDYKNTIPQKFYDFTKMYGPFSLAGKEKKNINFSYKIPESISGQNLGIEIDAIHENGLPLGWNNALMNVSGGTGLATVKNANLSINGKEFYLQEAGTVHSKEKPVLNIVLSNPTKNKISLTPSIDVHQRPSPNKILSSLKGETLLIEPGKEVKTSIDLPTFDYSPQVYVGEVSFLDSNNIIRAEKLEFRYTITGDIVTINKVLSDQSSVSKGQTFNITINYSGTPPDKSIGSATNNITSADFNLKLFNQNNKLIVNYSDKTNFNQGYLKTISVTAKENALALRAEIAVIKDGKTLASYKTDLSSNYQQQKGKFDTRDLLSLPTLLAIIFIILLVLAIIFIKKIIVNKIILTIITIVLIVLFISFTYLIFLNKASAISVISQGHDLDNGNYCWNQVCNFDAYHSCTARPCVEYSNCTDTSCRIYCHDASCNAGGYGCTVYLSCGGGMSLDLDLSQHINIAFGAGTPAENTKFTCGDTIANFSIRATITSDGSTSPDLYLYTDVKNGTDGCISEGCTTWDSTGQQLFKYNSNHSGHASAFGSQISAAADNLNIPTDESSSNYKIYFGVSQRSTIGLSQEQVWRSALYSVNYTVGCPTCGSMATNSPYMVGTSWPTSSKTNLCSKGDPSNYNITDPGLAGGTKTWNCIDQGTSVACSAYRQPSCGSGSGYANGYVFKFTETSYSSRKQCPDGPGGETDASSTNTDFPVLGESENWYCRGSGYIDNTKTPQSAECSASRAVAPTCGSNGLPSPQAKEYAWNATWPSSSDPNWCGTATTKVSGSIADPGQGNTATWECGNNATSQEKITCKAKRLACVPITCNGKVCGTWDNQCEGKIICGLDQQNCTVKYGTCTMTGTQVCFLSGADSGQWGACDATDPRPENCFGKECGSDDCGGVCGTCGPSATCVNGVCVGVVDGVCGSADGGNFYTKPTTNLCSAGTQTSVTGSGPWYWHCNGKNGGSNDSCTAYKKVDGQCGTANNHIYNYNDTSWGSYTFCSAGTSSPTSPSFPTQGNSTSWTCTGQNGGIPASCTARRNSATVICGNGVKEGTEQCDTGTFPGAPGTGGCASPAYCVSGCTCQTPNAVCGNGVKEGTEQCDTGTFPGALGGGGCNASQQCVSGCTCQTPSGTPGVCNPEVAIPMHSLYPYDGNSTTLNNLCLQGDPVSYNNGVFGTTLISSVTLPASGGATVYWGCKGQNGSPTNSICEAIRGPETSDCGNGIKDSREQCDTGTFPGAPGAGGCDPDEVCLSDCSCSTYPGECNTDLGSMPAKQWPSGSTNWPAGTTVEDLCTSGTPVTQWGGPLIDPPAFPTATKSAVWKCMGSDIFGSSDDVTCSACLTVWQLRPTFVPKLFQNAYTFIENIAENAYAGLMQGIHFDN